MPKHAYSDDEKRRKKHKKHKHAINDSDEDTRSFKKAKRPSSGSPDQRSRDRSKHAFRQSPPRRSRSRSPARHRLKKVKAERNDDNYRSHSSYRPRQTDLRIKREEDFDRRQDELRRMRRGMDRDQRRNHEARVRDREEKERDGRLSEAFANSEDEKVEKEKPNLGLSGALTEDTNTFRGVVIKYNEPAEAKVPKKRWRLYPFKGAESLKTLYLHRQSAFLLGRQRRIADIPIDHPSCSKQHAVIQFRMIEAEVDGKRRRRVKPYVIDLESANGTFVNNEKIETQRYVELKEQDVLKFGFSSREYVLLHDKSDTTDLGSDSEEVDD